METNTDKINFQTQEEALTVKEAHMNELKALSVKYKMNIEELIAAASNDEIDNQEDLFLIFKRSYLLSEQ